VTKQEFRHEDSQVPRLSSYLNVYNTGLVLLQRRGFALGYNKTDDTWTATKNGFELLAENPIELLGLASFLEEMNPADHADEYWWKIDKPDLLTVLDAE
jgi:hypothetical protein